MFLTVSNSIANETIGELVSRIRKKNHWSYADVETNSRGKIDRSYVRKIETGEVLEESLTVRKLRALAAGLKIPEDEVLDRIRKRKNGNNSTEIAVTDDLKVLFYGAAKWTEQEKKMLIDRIRADVEFIKSVRVEDSDVSDLERRGKSTVRRQDDIVIAPIKVGEDGKILPPETPAEEEPKKAA